MVLAIKSIKLYDKNTRNQFKNDLRVLSANKCKNIISPKVMSKFYWNI